MKKLILGTLLTGSMLFAVDMKSNENECDAFLKNADNLLEKTVNSFSSGAERGGYGMAAIANMQRYEICKNTQKESSKKILNDEKK